MRTKLERLEPLLLRTQLLGYETERSEMERWTGTPEGTCNVLRMFRETHAISARSSSTSQAERQKTKNQHTSLKLVCCSFFLLINEPPNVPYELLYDEPLESQLTMRKYFPLSLNRRILRPRYVEYPHQPLYYG